MRKRLILGDRSTVHRLEASVLAFADTEHLGACTVLKNVDYGRYLLRNATANIRVMPSVAWLGPRHCHVHELSRPLTLPSFTVCCKPLIIVDALTEYKLRELTERESAALQSFPESFKWALGKGHTQATQQMIGNAVPPQLSRVIMRGVIYST
jgi:hypothetical protein